VLNFNGASHYAVLEMGDLSRGINTGNANYYGSSSTAALDYPPRTNQLNPWTSTNTNYQGASTAVLSQSAYDTYTGITAAQDPAASFSPFGVKSGDEGMTIYLTMRPQSNQAMALMEMFKCDGMGASGDCEDVGGSSNANNRTGYNSDTIIRQFLDDTLQIGVAGADVRVMAHANIGGVSTQTGAQNLIENYPNVVNFKGSASLASTTSAAFVSLFIVIAKDSTSTEIAKSGVWHKAMKADADATQTTDGNALTKITDNSEIMFPTKRCGTFSNFVNNATCGNATANPDCLLYKGVANPRGTVAATNYLNPIKQTPRIFNLGRRLFVPDYGDATRSTDAATWGTTDYDKCTGGCCCNVTTGVPNVATASDGTTCEAPKISDLKFNHYDYFKGAIKEMAIFGKALTATEMGTFINAVDSSQSPAASSAGDDDAADNNNAGSGEGPTGGKSTYNCTIQVTVNGTTTTQAGQHCYNGVYTGAGSNGVTLVGAGDKLECEITGFTFKVGLKVNGTGANTGIAGSPHPTNAALAEALNMTARAQWATLYGLNNLLALARNDNLYNTAAASQQRYYLGPAQSNKQIHFQNSTATSCNNLEQNQHACLKVDFATAPTFTLTQSNTNISHYPNNFYDYTVSAPFKFTIGGLNANAKEAIMENFKLGWNVHKPDGYYSGFNNYPKSLTKSALAGYFDHYGAPTASGRTAMSPATGLGETIGSTVSPAYANFEEYFAKSCGTSANPVAECNEDLSNLDGNPALYNPTLYFNSTGATNDDYFFRNLNVTLGTCTAPGSSTSTGDSTSTGSGSSTSTGTGTHRIVAVVTMDVATTCQHISEFADFARKYDAGTSDADKGVVSPGTAAVAANYPCAEGHTPGPCGRDLSCAFAGSFAAAVGGGASAATTIIADVTSGRRRRLEAGGAERRELPITAENAIKVTMRISSVYNQATLPTIDTNTITQFTNLMTPHGVTITDVAIAQERAAGGAATTGSKKSSFATSRYSVNAVFPMLAALLLVAFGMRA